MADYTPESTLVVPISGNTLKTGLGDEHRLICDSDGRLDVVIGAALPTGDNVIGQVKITDGTNEAVVLTAGADNIVNTTNQLVVAAFNCGLDAGGNWERIRSDGTNTDNQGVDSVGALRTSAHLKIYHRAGNNWDRLTGGGFYDNLTYVSAILFTAGVVHGEDLDVGAGNSEPIKVRTEDGTIPAGEKQLEVIGLGHNYDGSNWKRSRSDIGLNLVGTIEAEHFQIHEGAHYFVYDYDTDIDIVTPKYWHIIAPDTATRIHVWFEVYTEAEAVIEIFENPTTTANGTGLTELNSDRNSANEAALTTFKDPTVSVDGTLIMTFRNASEKKVGGVATRDQEIILKQAEQYLFKVTSDADDNKSVLHIQWYEV